MNLDGIIIGFSVFLIIGIFHPIVIKSEYYFTYKVWKKFLAAGLIFILLSVLASNHIASTILSVIGFTCFWSIKELKEQRERVRKGWYPENPNRRGDDE